MHVSLPRRSHRFGLSMQYLLWICFGLLAVVPWQIICGQDEADRPRVNREADDWTSDVVRPSSKRVADDPNKQDQSTLTKQNKKGSISLLTVRSQSPPSDSGPFAEGPSDSGGFLASDQLTGRSGQAYGVQLRASGITGPAIGRTNAIFPIEMMPYAFANNSLFFADIRGFMTTNPTNGGYGGNFGGGFRQYIPALDRIFGVNCYYDYDNSSGALFREIGFGAESLGELYDVRANAYLPTGSSAQQLSLNNVNGTQQFVSHFLLVDQQKTVANALHGFDAEIGVPLPGRVAERHDIRVFGGGYWFEGNQIPSFGGWKLRAQGNITPSLSVNLQVSNDQQFNTNVVFGGTWTFGGYRQGDGERKSQYNRMTAPVIRQYNMVVGTTVQTLKGVTVNDPTTGNPYFFEHVSSNAVGIIHDGTVEHPFLTLPDAQAVATNGNIIFVHANSAYTGEQVALQPNIRVLGEASTVEHQVNTSSGSLLLPHPTTGVAVRPIFANSPANGVILADNSEFSGFQINKPAGIGILGSGVQNVTIRQTDVTGSGGEGVNLTNTLGTITFKGDTINDPTGNATTFHVSGTKGTIIFTKDPLSTAKSATGASVPTPGVINNVVGTGGSALLVEKTIAGSNVDFTGSTVNDSTGNGITVTNNAGVVTLGDVKVTSGLGIGLNILNNPGFIFGNGTIDITNSALDAINIQGTAKGGTVFFTDPAGNGTNANPAAINIVNRQARGIFLNNNAGNVTFLTPVNISAAGTLGPAAIDYQNSAGNVTFNNSININGGGPGILIGTLGNATPSTGFFSANGNTNITSTTGIGIQVIGDKSTVLFNGGANATTTINQRGSIGVEVISNQGSVTFAGTTTINNQNTSTSPAVDVRRNVNPLATVTFNTLNVEGAAGPTTAPFGGIGVNIGGANIADANPSQVTINVLNIGDVFAAPANGGTALFANNVGTNTGTKLTGLTIGRGTINSVFGPAVDIENSTIQVSLTSVSSSQSPTSGLILINDQSFTPLPNQVTAPLLNDFMFQVLGNTNTVLRNGGTLTLATNDGIYINQTGKLFQTGDVSFNQITASVNLNNGGGNGVGGGPGGGGGFGGGIVANGLLQLRITNSDISNNVHNGILATNIPLVNISTSNFALNGIVAADNAIHLTANTTLLTTNKTLGQYEWNITNNNTTSAGIAAGFISSAGAGNLVAVDSGGQTLKVQNSPTQTTVTPLVFNFTNNTELINGIGSGVGVNWTGFESGSINQNTVNLTGGDRAFSIVNTDSVFLTNFNILGNTVIANGGTNIGLFVNNFGPTNLSVGTLLANGVNIPNTFTFNSPLNGVIANNDIAMQLSVLNSTTTTSFLSFTDNIINMTGDNPDQGIVFTLLQGPATVNLSNNTITINTQPQVPIIGQGIDFQNVLGTINLEGALSNTITVNGANTIPNNLGVVPANWVFLTGNRTGRIIANGLLFQ